jgi:Ankyrin repeats (3 copies)
MSKVIRMTIELIGTLPPEIRDKILIKFSTEEILNIGRDKAGEYVWWRKCHKTVDQAIKYGNLIGMKYLIDLKYWTGQNHLGMHSNNIIDGVDYINMLLLAIDNRHLNIVKYFIEECGINVNIDHGYLLMNSIVSGSLEIIKYFFENGANIEMFIDIFISDLINSKLRISIEMLEYFVGQGADLHHYADAIYKNSAINRNSEIANYFVKKNMVIDIISCNNRIAEHNAEIDSIKKDLIRHDAYIHKCCSSSALLSIIPYLDVITLKYFIDYSDDIHEYIDKIFRGSVNLGNSEIVNYLIKQNLVDIHDHIDMSLHHNALFGPLNDIHYESESDMIIEYDNMIIDK